MTGGSLILSPQNRWQSHGNNFIFNVSSQCPTTWEFMPIVPNQLYRYKAWLCDYIHAIVTSSHWPIYIDAHQTIVDSSIFLLRTLKMIMLFLQNTMINCRRFHVRLFYQNPLKLNINPSPSLIGKMPMFNLLAMPFVGFFHYLNQRQSTTSCSH